MKALTLGSVVLAAMIAGPAMAADMPLKAPPMAPYSWTGFYLGGNAGYSFGKADSTYIDPNFFGFVPTFFSGSEKLDGIIGGGQIGYNYQTSSSWVVGVEADIQGSGEKGSSSFASIYSVGVDCDIFCSTVSGNLTAAINWFGTVRGRLGMLVTPTVLLYGTGGLAYGGVNAGGSITDGCGTGKPCGPVTWTFGGTTTRLGWTLGAGLEAAVPSSKNWTWKLEYLYIDFGSVSGSGFEPNADFGPLPYTWSARVTDNILRVGLNYNLH
jgi:outer membrane immunogenic protein